MDDDIHQAPEQDDTYTDMTHYARAPGIISEEPHSDIPKRGNLFLTLVIQFCARDQPFT